MTFEGQATFEWQRCLRDRDVSATAMFEKEATFQWQ